MDKKLAATILIGLLSATSATAESTWPQFRGPSGQGRSEVDRLPLHWDESSHIAWKTPIHGQGWSSPVVADGKAWLTSATDVKASEAEKQAKIEGNMSGGALEVARTVILRAIEVDLASGQVLRQIELFNVNEPQPIHSLNSYASPTPVLADGRLYCHFGDFGTACLDTSTGEILWQRRIQLDHRVGPGSSPYLYKNLLILTCDGADKQYVTALNASSGEIVWHTDRPPIRSDEPEFRKSFCTPLVIDVKGQDQLVIPGAQWFIAYEPLTGKELWRIDHGRGFSNVPAPVFDGRHVYLCTGFMSQELWAVDPEGSGDITETHVKWKQSKQIPTMPSPIVYDNRIYAISDAGIAQCFDTSTGELLWKERIGGKYSASPLLAGGRLYFCSHEGLTTVLATGDEYQELAKNELDGQLMASPVPVENDLLLRTDTHLYRISN